MNFNKFKEIIFGLIVLIASANQAMAQTCTESISPTTSCFNLAIELSNRSINIASGITLSSNGGDAMAVRFGPTGLDFTVQSSAVVGSTGFSQTSLFGFRNYTGNINSFTNLGSITNSSSGDIWNQGTISTLNNLQGATSALRYRGVLPTNYNIIISSSSNYGKLLRNNSVSGTTTFGISALSAGSSIVSVTPYTSVISGVTAAQLGLSGTTFSSTTNNYSYTLYESATANIWDLLITGFNAPPTGPSTVNTQQSLVNTASTLQSTYTLQNSVLANSFAYDCTVFGAHNICVSTGGRNTAVSAANGLNNSSALLIVAYRLMPSVRLGAYVDQNLSVNNGGSTVNLGNNSPLIGLFGAWNERLDGTGTEVKVSAAYGKKNTTINRGLVGDSEAGTGSSQLNSQGAQVTAKYGFAMMPDVIVSPYAGLRYTQNNMNGYTEGTSGSVTAPLTYSALNTNATTVLAGVSAIYKGIPQTNLFASAGLETDTKTANGSYSATGVSGLTPVNFNSNPVRTRPTVTLGATYDVEKNQRVGVMGIYRQEAYQPTATTTVMATYTVGL